MKTLYIIAGCNGAGASSGSGNTVKIHNSELFKKIEEPVIKR